MDASAQANAAALQAAGVQVSASSVAPPTSYSSLTQRLLGQLIANSSANANAHYAAANQQLGSFVNLPQAPSDYPNYMVAANQAQQAYQASIYGLNPSYGDLLLATPTNADFRPAVPSTSNNVQQNLTPSHPYALISSPPTNSLCSRRGTPIDGRDSNPHSCMGLHHLGGQAGQQPNLRPATPQLTSINGWTSGGTSGGAVRSNRNFELGNRAMKRSSGGGSSASVSAMTGQLSTNPAFYSNYMSGGTNDEDQLTIALNHHQQQRENNNSSSSSILRGPKLRRLSSYGGDYDESTEETLEAINAAVSDPSIQQTTAAATIVQLQQQAHQPAVSLTSRQMATAASNILPGLSVRQRQLMNLDTSLTAAEAAAIHATAAAATSLNSVNVAVQVAAASNTVEQFVAAMNAASVNSTLVSPQTQSLQQVATAYALSANQALTAPATQPNACPVCASCQIIPAATAITACSCIHHHHCNNCHHHHHSLCTVCPSGSAALQQPGFSGLSSMLLSPGVSANGLMGASSSLNHSAAQSMVQQQANLLGFAQQQQQNAANHQRNLEIINPVHSSLLASRYMQQEREQHSTNLFYQQFQQRQNLQQQQPGLAFTTTSQLSQPLIALMPRMTQMTQLTQLNNLSMLAIFQHPTDATTLVLNGGTGAAVPAVQVGAAQPAAGGAVPEPQPVGATVDQIKKYSSLMNYIKDPKVPELEKERCTVCLMEFEHDESLRSLHCSHIFHIECIDRWLVYNKKCPVCRVDMDKACAASASVPLPIAPNLLNFQ